MRYFKIFFTALLLLAVLFNLYQAYAQALVQLQDHKTIPLHSLGYQFIGLEKVFKNVRTVGYYTDKNLDNPLNIAQYEQAQYMLAPTVLDLNQTRYHWIILDCTSPQAAMEAVRRLKLVPAKAHNGIILALNPMVFDQ
jgi:hypothetical protein